jgi:hypothetical protein
MAKRTRSQAAKTTKRGGTRRPRIAKPAEEETGTGPEIGGAGISNRSSSQETRRQGAVPARGKRKAPTSGKAKRRSRSRA